MYLKKEKGSLWKWTAGFFAAMVVFTLLSRAAYQNSVAVVSTARPGTGTIAHSVRVSGKTVQNQELAVTTESGLRIAAVHVNEGQQVKKGEVLFSLDREYLQETIRYQEQELQKQKLSIEAAWSQDAAAAQQRSNEQARAEENYHAAVSQAQTGVDRAGQELNQAKAALEAFQKGASAKDALTAAWQEAADALGAAQEAVQALEEKLSQAAEEEQEAIQAELTAAQAALQQAQTVEAEAKAALDAYVPPSGSEAELKSAVEQAQQAYDDAQASLGATQTSHSRAIQFAALPMGSSNAAQIGQITYDQMAHILSKLKALEEGEGKILAPVDGIVTGSFVQTGEKTTDSTAVLLADLRQGCKFSGLVEEAQSQYIGVGDKVLIQAGSNGKQYEDLPVTTFAGTQDIAGGYRITVQLPAGSLSLGESAQLQFTKKSQPYDCCVPLSALGLDAQNQPYVLVTEEVNTVLGTQLQARKVSVTVLDKNETMAALAEGALSSQQQVITGADKPIEPGSRVRVAS